MKMQYQQRIKTLNRSLRQFTFIIITRPPLRAHKPWELEYGRTSADIGGQKRRHCPMEAGWPWCGAREEGEGGAPGGGDSQNSRPLHALCFDLGN